MAKTLSERRARLDELIAGQQKIQDEYRGKAMPQNVGDQWNADMAEIKQLQDEIDRDLELQAQTARSSEAKARMGEVADPTLPKTEPEKDRKTGTHGYLTLGEYVIASQECRDFVKNGARKGESFTIEAPVRLNLAGNPRPEDVLVPLSFEQRKAYEQLRETKAVPTIGAGVIEPQRVAEFPRVAEREMLSIRSVFRTFGTDSNAIEYLREESHTLAAAETSPSGSKPESTIQWSLQTANVRDIAVWMPVTNQQLRDMPQMRSLIDDALRYDVAKREDDQLLWGDGVAPNIAGIFDAGLGQIDIASNGRYVSTDGDTLLDAVRMGITDVRIGAAKANPDVLLIHPIDFETMALEKGSDLHYIWAVVPTEEGRRIWSLRVVESISLEEPSGEATPERRLAVMDTRRANAIYDRNRTNVTVGLVDDQFIKNQRTILAEEAIAHAIFRPAAIAYLITRAETT